MPTAAVNPFAGQAIAGGRYDVVELLGEGSMGAVYRARDNRLEAEVVIKVPNEARLLSPEFRERFHREIRSLVRLTHPHVVKILDVGDHDGVPYLVMQCLSGGSLKDQMTAHGGTMPPPTLTRWLMEVAKALDFIHAQESVHRDVKPANILFDGHGHPFVGDFGLAKVASLEREESHDASLTAAGYVVGTARYVAPELVMGLPYDGRVDQYSLAMTVYEVLSGRCPMEGPTPSATMVNQTMMVAPRLSDVVAGVPAAVADAVARGLAKRPEDRFPACADFAAAVLAGLPRATPAPARREPPRTDHGASSTSSTAPAPSEVHEIVSRGPKGRVPCPSCRRVLPLKPEHAGRRGRCVHCKVMLEIGGDLTTLRLAPEPKAERDSRGSISARPAATRRPAQQRTQPREEDEDDDFETLPLPGQRKPKPSSTKRKPAPKKKGKGKPPGDAGDLLIGEEVFGWRVGRTVALSLGLLLIALLIGVTVRITLFATQEEKAKDVPLTNRESAAEEGAASGDRPGRVPANAGRED